MMTWEKHANALAREHRTTPSMVRGMIVLDMLHDAGELPSAHHKTPSETLPVYAARMLAERGPMSTGTDFAAARERLLALRSVERVTLPDDRLKEAVAHLAALGGRRGGLAVKLLLGGDAAENTRALDRLFPPTNSAAQRAVMGALHFERHHLDAAVRLMLLPEPDVEWPDGRTPSPVALRDGVTGRFRTWAPAELDYDDIKDIAVVRAGLRLGPLARHAPGIVEAVVDLLVSMGIRATPGEVHRLIGGDIEQFHEYLAERARAKGDVPVPPRHRKRDATIEDLDRVLPAPISRLYDTALDRLRGSSRDKVSGADIVRIISNPHPQLQILATVVTFVGARKKAYWHKARMAKRATNNLAAPLMGIDVTNGAELAAGMEAHRLMMRSAPDRFEKQRANEDIDGWRFVIELVDEYLARADVPSALKTHLSGFRPAFPSGGAELFKQVREEITLFNQESKTLRDGELQPYLADVPRFLSLVLDAQRDFEAFRNHVKASAAALDAAPGVAAEDHIFTMEAELADGTVGEVTLRYALRPWTGIVADLNTRRAARKEPMLDDSLRPRPGGEPHDPSLFENRYAVVMLGATHAGEPVDYPMPIVRLHRDMGHWKPRTVPHGDAFETRATALKEFGLTTNCLKSIGAGIGQYERGKSGWARRARLDLGLFLLPVEEIHHSQLVGALHVASRAVAALRVGELTQWNVGSGLETGYDDDGEPFAVLLSIPKKKTEPRRTPLNSHCEELADKLMALARERFFGGGPIPPLRRADWNSKGPEFEALIFCTRTEGMRGGMINIHSRLLMSGTNGFKSHYMKYIWSKLSRMAGKTLDERREGHGQTTNEMAAHYDVLTPDEAEAQTRVRRDFAEARGQWFRGERETPLPDPPLETLQLERRRLVHEIEFLNREKLGTETFEAQARLRLVDAKIRRAQGGGR